MAYSDIAINVTAKQIEAAVKSIEPLKKQINDIPNALPQNLRFLVNNDGKSITAYWTELVKDKYDGLYTKRLSYTASFDGMSASKGTGALVKNIESTDSTLSKWHLELNYDKTEQTHIYRFFNWSWDGSKIVYAHPISCDFMYQSLKEKIDNIETGDVDLIGYAKKDYVDEVADALFLQAGLYDDKGELTKDWATLKQEYPDAFDGSKIKGNTQTEKSFFIAEDLKGKLVIDDEITFIGANAFKESSFDIIVVPDSVTYIGNYAFSSCLSLDKVVLSNNIKEIPYKCFYHSTMLNDLVIPSGVSQIEESAFEFCLSLINLTLPKSVTTIEKYAFHQCSLNNCYYEGSESDWNNIYIEFGEGEQSGLANYHNKYYNQEMPKKEVDYNQKLATKEYVDSEYQKKLTAPKDGGIFISNDTNEIAVKLKTNGGLKVNDTGEPLERGLCVDTDVVAMKEDLEFDYTKYDMPVVYINGDFDSIDEKTDIIKCDYSYENKGVTKTGYCTAKWQGSSSLNYPKKNFTIKFYTDAECTSKDKFEAKSGWDNEYKYCFKADWIDFSHSRNVASAELWGDVVNSRKDVNTEGTISNILSQVPNGGAIDGFPIFLVINGEWQGIYNWNIPKDDWTLGMGKGIGQKEVILCASGNNSASFKQDAVIGKDYDLEYATDEKDADGNQKPETVTAIQNSLNNLIRLVNASDGTDIDTTIAKYVDIQSVIDYFLFVVLTDNYDGILKNYLLGSYDYELTDENGNFVDYGKWFFGAYDLDAVFGLTINGKPDSFGNAFRDFTYSEAKDVAPVHKLFKLLWDYKNEDIIKRYKELVKEPMSLASVTTKFCNYTSKIPLIAYDEDAKMWAGVTNTSTNNLTQVITWYENRLDFLNNKLLGSDGGEIYTKIGEFTIAPQEVTVSAGQTEIPITLKFLDGVKVYHNDTLVESAKYTIDEENRKLVLNGYSVADGDTIKIQNELNQVYASEVSVGSGKKISRLNMVNNLKEFYIVADFPVVESSITIDGGAFNYAQRLFQFYTASAISTSAKTFYAEGVRSKGKWKFELNSDITANMKKADYKKAASQNNAPKNFGDMYFNKPVTNIGITTYPTTAVFPQGTTFTLYGIEE